MKQHITVEQFNELSEKGKERFFNWLREKDYLSQKPFLEEDVWIVDIGLMIEFLDEHTDISLESQIDVEEDEYYNLKAVLWDRKKEPCDVLWEAVKKLLAE